MIIMVNSQLIKISKIKSNPNNPRIIKDDKFKKLVKSIQEFPEMLNIRPVVVNKDLMVLGGNMRLKAAIEAGLKEVPIIETDLSEEKQKEFIIKDNVSGGEWNWDTLANDWDQEQLTDWGLDIPDFEPESKEIEEDDYEFADSIITDIVAGDLFEIGNHRLLCGDSTDSDAVVKLMYGKKADMVFTDPDFSMAIDLLKQAYSNAITNATGFGFWVCGDKQAVQLAMNDFDNFSHFLYKISGKQQ